MKKARTAGRIVAVLVLLAVAFAFGTRWRHDAKDLPARTAQPAPGPAPALTPGVVVFSRESQEQSGLATAAPSATVFRPVAKTFAVALDVRPLLIAQRQVATAQAELRAAESAERASRHEYERARTLFADDRNVSQKAMQAAESAWQADRAKVDAAAAAVREGEATAMQQFGPALATATGTTPQPLGRLASRQAGLVQVALPSGSADAAPATITLSAPGYPASKARRIAPAAQADGSLAGPAFLYRSDTAYPSGLRLQAELPLAANAVSGFLVPESSVVWYGNEPWVFVQSGADRFTRRALSQPQAVAGGLFTTTPFDDDDRIVVRGAQLLQSESLRPKASTTSACADPECDD